MGHHHGPLVAELFEEPILIDRLAGIFGAVQEKTVQPVTEIWQQGLHPISVHELRKGKQLGLAFPIKSNAAPVKGGIAFHGNHLARAELCKGMGKKKGAAAASIGTDLKTMPGLVTQNSLKQTPPLGHVHLAWVVLAALEEKPFLLRKTKTIDEAITDPLEGVQFMIMVLQLCMVPHAFSFFLLLWAVFPFFSVLGRPEYRVNLRPGNRTDRGSLCARFHHDLPEEERFRQLGARGKYFIDTIKMIAYRAETAMAGIVREKLSRHDDARSLLRAIYTTEADIVPDEVAGTLTVRLHQLANRMSSESVRHLCNELNAAMTLFPGTNLRLNYELVS